MSDVEAAIGTLRARFLSRSKEDLKALKAWAKLGAAPDDAHHRILHRLAGAAGTFGYAEISERAKAVEDQVVAGRSGNGPDLGALLTTLAKATKAA